MALNPIPFPPGNDLVGRYLRGASAEAASRAAQVEDHHVQVLAESSQGLVHQLDVLDVAHPYPASTDVAHSELAAQALAGPVNEAESDYAAYIVARMKDLFDAYKPMREAGAGTTGQWVRCLEALRSVIDSAFTMDFPGIVDHLFGELTAPYAPVFEELQARLERMTHPDKKKRISLGEALDELIPPEWQGKDFVEAMSALSKAYVAEGDSQGAWLAREGRARLLQGDTEGWTHVWDATATTDRSPPAELAWMEKIAIAYSLIHER